MGVFLGVIAVISLLSIDGSLRKNSKQQQEIIELLQELKEKQ